MIRRLLSAIFSSRNDRLLKQYAKTVARINALGGEIAALSLEFSLVLRGLGLAAGVIALAFFISYIGVRHAAEVKLPLLQSLVRSAELDETRRIEAFLRQNLNAMAVKLGEMQANLMRLDALGERLSSAAGVRPGDFRFGEVPARGGAVTTVLVPPRDLSLGEFNRQLDSLALQMETRSDYYDVLELQLFNARVRQDFTPTALPVNIRTWDAAGFGWRLDPITGRMAMHEGIDFIAAPGTPIHAAASGVVVTAEFLPVYGNMVEIDHGGGLVTRYAHASKVLVKRGQLVKQGDKIAEVGSTGRSTGPHLHFEVRFRGAAKNPARFLASRPGLAANKH
jgi:murein DD-endopeptidase MepM/ murein hydrolase activator NlpD